MADKLAPTIFLGLDMKNSTQHRGITNFTEPQAIQKKRIEYIDFAKGFSILSIVIFHYCQPYTSGLASKAIMLGGAGVHLFFILSGFGLGLSSKKVSPLNFYRKRFLKILLPYYFVVLLIFVINSIHPIYEEDGLYALGGHLLLYKMFDESIVGSFGHHLWFVSTIVQFYIFFPLISSLQHKSSSLKVFVAISFLISLAYWIFLGAYSIYGARIFNSFFLQYIWEFNMGIALAKLYLLKGIEFWNKSKILLFTISLLSFSSMALLIVWLGSTGRVFNDVFSSFGFLCLSAFSYSVCKSNLDFIKKPILFVGSVSYELYLIHMLIFILVNDFLAHVVLIQPGIIYSLFFVLPLSILLSSLFMRSIQSVYQSSLVSRFL